jgi:hypothetical protein
MWWNGGALGRSATTDLAQRDASAKRLWLAIANEGSELSAKGRASDQLVVKITRLVPASQ